jgi:hypothetical protein
MAPTDNQETNKNVDKLLDEEKNNPVEYKDALAALEKKAWPENAKEIEALVSLIETQLMTSKKDINDLLGNISKDGKKTDADKKALLAWLIEQFTVSPDEIHEEARNAAYKMLTGKENKKKWDGPFGLALPSVGLMLKNVWKKLQWKDLKLERKKQQDELAAFEKENITILNELKKKLGLPVTESVVDPTKKVETRQTQEEPWIKEDPDYDVSHIGDINWMKYSDMIVRNDLRSHGVLKSSTWMTLCSKTVRLDMKDIFNIDVPVGSSALEAKDIYKESDVRSDSTQQKNDGKVVDIKETYTPDMKWDAFDIFTHSNGAPQYGHRCRWFRSYPSGKMFVVDYYMKWDKFKKPVPIEEYMAEICAPTTDWWKWRKVLKIVWYDTAKQIVDNQDIVQKQKEKNFTMA